VDGVRLTAIAQASSFGECLGRHRISPGRPLTDSYRREKDGMAVAWYRGSLVRSDILRAPVQGGYQR
jgi:hypothetical protein